MLVFFAKKKHEQTNSTWNILGTFLKNHFGSKPPSGQMFQILLQECTLIKINKHGLFSGKKLKIQKYLKILENSAKKHCRLETFGSYSWRVIIAFFFFQSISKYWKTYQKKRKKTQNKNRLGSKTTLPALFLVPINDLLSLHVILFKQKHILENTRKYRNKYWRNTRNTKPFRLRTTLPAKKI